MNAPSHSRTARFKSSLGMASQSPPQRPVPSGAASGGLREQPRPFLSRRKAGPGPCFQPRCGWAAEPSAGSLALRMDPKVKCAAPIVLTAMHFISFFHDREQNRPPVRCSCDRVEDEMRRPCRAARISRARNPLFRYPHIACPRSLATCPRSSRGESSAAW